MIRVYFVGTGGGAPSPYRSLPSYLIRREGFYALFDCGEGTQRNLMEYRLGIMSIKLIGITHMHGDHVLGLPGLIQTMGLLDRKEPLYIMGPKAIKDFIERTSELTGFRAPFEIRFIDSYEDENIRIYKFPTCHTIESYGYIFEEKERKGLDVEKLRRDGINDWQILRELKAGKEVRFNGKTLKPEDYIIVKPAIRVAYTGDTSYCEKVIDSVKGVNLLLHDSTFLDEKDAREWGHSNAIDAATVAKQAEVKRLALIHISSRYRDTSQFVRLASRIFDKVFVPEDLSYYILDREP
ncbi:MAG: ribonuclease Z [Sulfolobaceae archaeon]|nr:ribonuclease Z [Sulfolobaceae archaeon]